MIEIDSRQAPGMDGAGVIERSADEGGIVERCAQTFTATADAQVQEANASTTFGTSTALRVDAGADPDVESYLRFAVSGVSGSVQTATLRLWVTSATANGPAVYTTDNTWSETTITWANRPARTGSGVDDKASVPSGAWVDFNVTSLAATAPTTSYSRALDRRHRLLLT